MDALSVGMRLQAQMDGVFYAAEVVALKRRTAKAPVRVHFMGYGDEDDAWVSLDDIRSKAIAAGKKAEAATAKPSKEAAPKAAAPKVDYSVLTVGMRVQVESDGVWYASDIKAVSKDRKRAKAPVKIVFAGYTEDSAEWVGADRLRSKALKNSAPAAEAKAAKGGPEEKKEKRERPKKGEKAEKAEKGEKGERRPRRFSIADQVARFERAKAEKNERYLNIASVFDGSYLKGKRVLIVGASKGLGLCLVKEAVAQGATCIATCREGAGDLQSLGATVISGVEVTDLDSMKKMASAVKAPLDYAIFNAGYFPDIADNLDSPQDKEAIKQIDVCALGPLRCVTVLKAEGLLKGCKVAVISSQAGSTQWRFTQNKDKGGDYGHHMSRAACNMGCALMSEELKKNEVPVVTIHPGFCRTGMTSKYSHIWDVEGAVPAEEGAKRVLHEVSRISMKVTGKFFNAEDGLEIPW